MTFMEEIKNSVIDMDDAGIEGLVRKALEGGAGPLDIVNGGLIAGIEIVGDRFRNFEVFLPEVILASKAFKAGFAVVAPMLKDTGYEPKGRVLIGSVEGDSHDIGKNIVMALLQGNGYEVHDAGVDVPADKFVTMALELNANVIGMSSLLTSTMAKMKDTVAALEAAGLRGRVKVIVGGAPVSREYADSIGADGYGEDASEAVRLVGRLLAG